MKKVYYEYRGRESDTYLEYQYQILKSRTLVLSHESRIIELAVVLLNRKVSKHLIDIRCVFHGKGQVH